MGNNKGKKKLVGGITKKTEIMPSDFIKEIWLYALHDTYIPLTQYFQKF